MAAFRYFYDSTEATASTLLFSNIYCDGTLNSIVSKISKPFYIDKKTRRLIIVGREKEALKSPIPEKLIFIKPLSKIVMPRIIRRRTAKSISQIRRDKRKLFLESLES